MRAVKPCAQSLQGVASFDEPERLPTSASGSSFSSIWHSHTYATALHVDSSRRTLRGRELVAMLYTQDLRSRPPRAGSKRTDTSTPAALIPCKFTTM